MATGVAERVPSGGSSYDERNLRHSLRIKEKTTCHTSSSGGREVSRKRKKHNFRYTSDESQVRRELQRKDSVWKCAICLDVHRTNGVSLLSRLSCFHVFHTACLLSAFAHNNNPKKCPLCRRVVTGVSASATYKTMKALVDGFPVQCSGRQCLLIRSTESLSLNNQTEADCPYPFSNFANYGKKDFFRKDNKAICQFFERKLTQMGYQVCSFQYLDQISDSKHFEYLANGAGSENQRLKILNSPGFTVELHHERFKESGSPIIFLYYAVCDLEKGAPSDYFINQLLDFNTDCIFLQLRCMFPGMFQPETNVWIHHYEMQDDAIFLIENGIQHPLPFRQIWNPELMQFSFDKLKEAMQSLGIDFQTLFYHKAYSAGGWNLLGEVPDGVINLEHF